MSVERAIELQERAWELQAAGSLDAAFDAAQQALELIVVAEGRVSGDAANLLNDLSEIERDRQRFGAAVAFAEQSRDVQLALGGAFEGEDAQRIRMKTASLLGELYRIRGDYAQAELELLAALVIARELVDAPEVLALSANDLGVLYKYWGRFDEAMAHYGEALRVMRAIHGEGSLQVGGLLHNIGGLFHARGDFAAAEPPSRQAWEISRSLRGEHDTATLRDATAHAAVLQGLGRYRESEAIYRRALGAYRAALGPRHYEVAATLHDLAAVVSDLDDRVEAELLYREALALKQDLLGDDNPDVALTQNNLGRLLAEGGRSLEAENLLETANATLARRLPHGHPIRERAERNLAQVRGLR
ncbi:MAG TPA: tetratricopeptide repeat protein [Polyangiaceae bacterium]|nr:tetratricopeptide repeat protein [Polyangiaceae bacterium]